MSNKKQDIVISLSGGGDRTFVLAGIIHFLKNKYNIRLIVTISGSSYTVPIALTAESISSALSRINRFDILNFAKEIPHDQILEKQGLFEIDPSMYSYIQSLTGVKKGTQHTPILLPTAVDMSKEDLPVKYLGNMEFGKAVRASMAFPYLITPLKSGKSLYIDGGLKGDYQTKPLSKFKNVPKIVLNLAEKIDPGALLASIKYAMKQLKLPILKLKDLKYLYDNDQLLKKVTQFIPRHFKKNANFIFNIHGLSDYNLILPSNKRQKLFLKGYFLGELINAKIQYSLDYKTWTQYSNENVYDLNLKDSVLAKMSDGKNLVNKKQAKEPK